ncbi:hypothetical protein D3C81_2026390 [compost metagenome]
MIDDELHRDIGRQRTVAERPAIAQLQPGGPVAEGALVAAHGIGCGAGGDEGLSGGTGAVGQAVQRQRGIRQVVERKCIIHYVQRTIY